LRRRMVFGVPTYHDTHDTHDSKSGHAEAIRVTFDPSVLSYEDLLEKWFFRLHDHGGAGELPPPTLRGSVRDATATLRDDGKRSAPSTECCV